MLIKLALSIRTLFEPPVRRVRGDLAVAPTPQRERRGDAGGRRRMTTRARPGGSTRGTEEPRGAGRAHAYMDTQSPSATSVRSGRHSMGRSAGTPAGALSFVDI